MKGERGGNPGRRWRRTDAAPIPEGGSGDRRGEGHRGGRLEGRAASRIGAASAAVREPVPRGRPSGGVASYNDCANLDLFGAVPARSLGADRQAGDGDRRSRGIRPARPRRPNPAPGPARSGRPPRGRKRINPLPSSRGCVRCAVASELLPVALRVVSNRRGNGRPPRGRDATIRSPVTGYHPSSWHSGPPRSGPIPQITGSGVGMAVACSL